MLFAAKKSFIFAVLDAMRCESSTIRVVDMVLYEVNACVQGGLAYGTVLGVELEWESSVMNDYAGRSLSQTRLKCKVSR